MATKKPRRCGNCKWWTKLDPDDETAGEGRCHTENWKGPLFVYDASGKMAGITSGYHPAVLRNDGCISHRFPKATP